MCSNIGTIMHPSDAQKIINKKQLKLMKQKCEGKEFCSVHACDSWWNTNHNCPTHESPIMWINFHCNGNAGGAMVTREVGSCEGGTKNSHVSICFIMLLDYNDEALTIVFCV